MSDHNATKMHQRTRSNDVDDLTSGEQQMNCGLDEENDRLDIVNIQNESCETIDNISQGTCSLATGIQLCSHLQMGPEKLLNH